MTRSRSVSLSEEPKAKSGSGKSSSGPREPLPFELPSNSPQGIAIRKARNVEIRNILDALQSLQENAKRRNDVVEVDEQGEPSVLKIRRPEYLPRSAERYRKEGLMSKDKYPSTLRKDRKAAKPNIPNATLFVAEQRPERYCYCREPDDGSGMIQCCAEFCLIGWVHLACSGLNDLPPETGTCKAISTIL